MKEDEIDFNKLEEESKAKVLDGIKAKAVKKADMNNKKLKRLKGKQQSLKDRAIPKSKRRKAAAAGGKNGPKSGKKGAEKNGKGKKK